MEKRALHSPDLSARNIERIAELFPQAITESRDDTGKVVRAIDFDLLRQELSDHIVEGPQERYQLDWPGKRAAAFAANAPIAKTLRPMREESVDFDRTRNLFIEGDNLDALKLLQESYLGKVKLIYIDPPYNTGNDFIYEDAFAESSAEYLARSGQRSETGDRLVANTDANGRFHSDWLSMMYPRLKLARNLLRPDGLIMASIDENEVSNLTALCDQVFGDANRMGVFVWERKKKPSFLRKTMGTVTEYIVVYARTYDDVGPLVAGLGEEGKKYPINNAGNARGRLVFPPGSVSFGIADGVIQPQDMSEGNIVTVLERPVTIRDGKNADALVLDGEWRYSQQKLDALIADGGEIRISKIPFRPNYINRDDRVKKTANLLSHRTNGVATNEDATAEVRQLFGSDVIDFPKPTGLLTYLFAAATIDGDIILDFFAGSGSTGHAVMSLNAADHGNRRFILVQLDEVLSPSSLARKRGYATLADVARERLRRAGNQVKREAGLLGSDHDVGFRSLRVATTNMADTLATADELTQFTLADAVISVKPDRTDEDLLFQVMLDWGLDLAEPIAVEEVAGTRVLSVASDALVACFSRGVSDAVVQEIARRHPLRAVFLDAGFASDAARINAEQIFRELSPETEVRTI
jgi:adenine-specific DNA-methyltransferase